MDLLEQVSDDAHQGYFVDLYVRPSNEVAVGMYERMGYSVYRRVKEYYGALSIAGGGNETKAEDAFGESNYMNELSIILKLIHDQDMRKPLSKDPHRKSVRPNGRDVLVAASSVS